MLDDAYFKALREEGQGVNPLLAYLGAVFEIINPSEARLKLEVSKYLLQGAGVVAGGILLTMADEAMAHVVMANLEPGVKTATVEMNMRYLRSAREGTLFATSRITRQGRTIITTESEVRDQGDNLLALAGASFIVL